MRALRVVSAHDRFDTESDIEDIIGLGDLLSVMLAQPDADTAMDGMQRVAWVIVDRAKAIRERTLGGTS